VTVKDRRSAFRFKMNTPQRAWRFSGGFFMSAKIGGPSRESSPLRRSRAGRCIPEALSSLVGIFQHEIPWLLASLLMHQHGIEIAHVNQLAACPAANEMLRL
jgi:hypothetical protein